MPRPTSNTYHIDQHVVGFLKLLGIHLPAESQNIASQPNPARQGTKHHHMVTGKQ